MNTGTAKVQVRLVDRLWKVHTVWDSVQVGLEDSWNLRTLLDSVKSGLLVDYRRSLLCFDSVPLMLWAMTKSASMPIWVIRYTVIFCSDTSVLCLICCDGCCVAYRLVVVLLLRQYLLLLLAIQGLLHAEPLVSFVSWWLDGEWWWSNECYSCWRESLPLLTKALLN